MLPIVLRITHRHVPYRATGFALLIFLVCGCVVLQVLGAPVTLLYLLTSDVPTESLSEDVSIPAVTPEPELINRDCLYKVVAPSLHHIVRSSQPQSFILLKHSLRSHKIRPRVFTLS